MLRYTRLFINKNDSFEYPCNKMKHILEYNVSFGNYRNVKNSLKYLHYLPPLSFITLYVFFLNH